MHDPEPTWVQSCSIPRLSLVSGPGYFIFLHPFTLRTDPASDLSFVSDTLLSATILAYCPTTTKTSYVNLRLCSHCHWKSVGGPGRFDGKKGPARGTVFPLQKRQTPWQNPMAPNAIQSSNAPRCKCEQGLKYTLGSSFLEDASLGIWRETLGNMNDR